MLRSVGGVVAGVALAIIVIMGIEAVGHWAVPLPPGVDPTDPAVITVLPLPAKATIVLAWFGGSLIGGLVANLIAHRRWPATIVAAFVLAGCITTFVTIPHPPLMVAIGLALPILAAAIGWQISPIRPVGEESGDRA